MSETALLAPPVAAAPPAAKDKDKPKATTFNCDGQIEILLKRENKTCMVRFPSDDELETRQRGIRTIIHKQGPDATVTRVEGVDEANDELLGRIRQDTGGAEFEPAEASLVIERVVRAEADEATREGEAYAIPIKVMGGVLTTHRLRIPKESEIRAYRKAAYCFVDKRHGKQQLKMFLGAIGDFYDKLAKEQTVAEGYDEGTPIPVCHKVAAVTELVHIMDAEGEEEDPAENFL